jgi:hypothetical protein
MKTISLSTKYQTLILSSNDTSAFAQWAAKYFTQPMYITQFVINAVMANYDRLEHEGADSRGTIQEWLWNRCGQEIELS